MVALLLGSKAMAAQAGDKGDEQVSYVPVGDAAAEWGDYPPPRPE